jgi:hypothetical protein
MISRKGIVSQKLSRCEAQVKDPERPVKFHERLFGPVTRRAKNVCGSRRDGQGMRPLPVR